MTIVLIDLTMTIKSTLEITLESKMKKGKHEVHSHLFVLGMPSEKHFARWTDDHAEIRVHG